VPERPTRFAPLAPPPELVELLRLPRGFTKLLFPPESKDPSMKVYEIKCKGMDGPDPCPKQVTYERETIPAIVSETTAGKPGRVGTVVYLTCPLGHRFPYRVTATGLA
jgi:hypothetical protein